MLSEEEKKERKREYSIIYREKNKEKLKIKKKEYYHATKETRKDSIKASYQKYCRENKEKLREKRKAYDLKRKPLLTNYNILKSIKQRSRSLNLHCNLTIEDILPPEVCPVFGFPLKKGEVGFSKESPSVDRIIPSLGYVKGNIQVISNKANMMKSDATPEELVLFAKWVQRTYPEMF